MRSQRHDHDGDHHPQRRQQRSGRDRPPNVIPRGGQSALGQDQDQRAVAEDLGQLSRVESDAGAGFTDDHADAEIEQQGGKPGTYRETNRRHGDQQHQGPDQQREVEVGDRKGMHGVDMSYSRRVSRAKLVRRISLSVVVLVVIAIVVGPVVGVSLIRRPLQQTSGQLSLSGLTAKVTVLRDDRGVPQIYADNAQDLFRAQGYVAAQDRFFEMDVRRHITAGRLSEMVGKDGLQTDRVIRTMGWRRVAEAELPKLAPSTRQYLQAYADGVNAYITKAGSPDNMGVEYSVLGQSFPDYRVEPWTPADSLTWLKAMAWDLRGDYDNELTRARLVATITRPDLRRSSRHTRPPPILRSSRHWTGNQDRSAQPLVRPRQLRRTRVSCRPSLLWPPSPPVPSM